jgi:hypothetical protein
MAGAVLVPVVAGATLGATGVSSSLRSEGDREQGEQPSRSVGWRRGW